MAQIPKNKFLVGYTGTIGASNALGTVVDAAEQLKHLDDIAFVIVGKGREKDSIQEKIDKLKLKNIHIIDPIPKRQVQSMLSHFDVCYIGLTRDPLFRFGVSPNKLFDYMVSGKPIIYGIDSGKYRPVDDLNVGIQVPPEDATVIVKAVLELRDLPDAERVEMGGRGKAAAMAHHEYATLAAKLEQVLLPQDETMQKTEQAQ